ncbi:uncharacterized protein LOC141910017 isoform X2 [Tubulanus polymorphus]
MINNSLKCCFVIDRDFFKLTHPQSPQFDYVMQTNLVAVCYGEVQKCELSMNIPYVFESNMEVKDFARKLIDLWKRDDGVQDSDVSSSNCGWNHTMKVEGASVIGDGSTGDLGRDSYPSVASTAKDSGSLKCLEQAIQPQAIGGMEACGNGSMEGNPSDTRPQLQQYQPQSNLQGMGRLELSPPIPGHPVAPSNDCMPMSSVQHRILRQIGIRLEGSTVVSCDWKDWASLQRKEGRKFLTQDEINLMERKPPGTIFTSLIQDPKFENYTIGDFRTDMKKIQRNDILKKFNQLMSNDA